MRLMRLIPFLFPVTLALAASAACAETTAAGESSLGRLFLTPEWRSALERQRQMNVQQTRRLEGDSVRLDGVVVRSSGKSTVWINGQPQTEGAYHTGVTTTVSRQHPGRAMLSTGATPSVDLKVGVTFDQASGEKVGGLAAGEIRVHRK